MRLLTSTTTFVYSIPVGFSLLVLGLILLGEVRGARWGLLAVGATLLGIAGGCLAANAYTLHEESKVDHGHSETARATPLPRAMNPKTISPKHMKPKPTKPKPTKLKPTKLKPTKLKPTNWPA